MGLRLPHHGSRGKNKQASEPFFCIASNNQYTAIAAILGSSVMCPKAMTTTNMWHHIKPCSAVEIITAIESFNFGVICQKENYSNLTQHVKEWLFKLANYRLAVDIQAISLSAGKMFSSAGEVSIQDVLHHGVILWTCCCS